jgi:hypothetical protein
VSHAAAFRKEMERAFGVERWNEAEQRFERAREYTPRERELFTETDYTLPVDFHSWRRAYSQALADAGATAQQASSLAGHTSLSAHARYLANSGKMRRVPLEALPDISLVRSLPPSIVNQRDFSGADGTRTRGLRRDRPAL